MQLKQSSKQGLSDRQPLPEPPRVSTRSEFSPRQRRALARSRLGPLIHAPADPQPIHGLSDFTRETRQLAFLEAPASPHKPSSTPSPIRGLSTQTLRTQKAIISFQIDIGSHSQIHQMAGCRPTLASLSTPCPIRCLSAPQLKTAPPPLIFLQSGSFHGFCWPIRA